MQMMNQSRIAAGDTITILIPASAGIKLPVHGVPQDAANMTVRLSPEFISVPVACLAEKIGSFATLPEISFDPPIAEKEVEV